MEHYEPAKYMKAVLAKFGAQSVIEDCETEEARKPHIARLKILQSEIDLMDLELEDGGKVDQIRMTVPLNEDARESRETIDRLESEHKAKTIEHAECKKQVEALEKRLREIRIEIAKEEELGVQFDIRIDDPTPGYMLNPDLGGVNPFRPGSKEHSALEFFIDYPEQVFKYNLTNHPEKKARQLGRKTGGQLAIQSLAKKGMIVIAVLPD